MQCNHPGIGRRRRAPTIHCASSLPGVAPPQEAIERLLEAWRGEIEAGAVYELIAARERDPRRAEILRRMAAAEAGHRQRLERRMRELGVPVPDPASVKVGWWTRLQVRTAPPDRLPAQ